MADSNGNLLIAGGDTVTMSGTGSSAISEITDNGNGTYTFTATNDAAEEVTYTGTVNTATITDTAVVTFTEPGIIDPIAGKTVEYADVSGSMFSFYQNGKFVKTICAGACTAGTGTFDYIGTWTEAAGVYTLKDADDITITQGAETANYATTHFTLLPGVAKDIDGAVQGYGIREIDSQGIDFHFFRDPNLAGILQFTRFGYILEPVDSGIPHHSYGTVGIWTIVNGKVVATTPEGDTEISTYAFDRDPMSADQGRTPNTPIVTITNNGDLEYVIVVGEFYQLKPSAIVEADDPRRTTEVALPVGEILSESAFNGKLLTVNDKTLGGSAYYFEAQDVREVGKGYIIAAGISNTGVSWGGSGDTGWAISPDERTLDLKIHYEGAGEGESTPKGMRFEDVEPVNTSLVSHYDGVDRNDFITTQAISRLADY